MANKYACWGNRIVCECKWFVCVQSDYYFLVKMFPFISNGNRYRQSLFTFQCILPMITNSNRIFNYQFVSVVIPSTTATRIYFPDLPNLRNVYTLGVVMYNSQVFTKDPNGLTISSFAGNNTFVTLVENNIERFQQLDGSTLNPIGGRPDNFSNVEGLLSIKPRIFDFSKSYIQFTSTFTPTANTVIPFGIYYLYPNQYRDISRAIAKN